MTAGSSLDQTEVFNEIINEIILGKNVLIHLPRKIIVLIDSRQKSTALQSKLEKNSFLCTDSV